ncbi:MAG: hypothetical protein KBT63_12185 [Porticoccaceae bacterium]|nr:hypothetical protein [Porticoccaceae bacterium]
MSNMTTMTATKGRLSRCILIGCTALFAHCALANEPEFEFGYGLGWDDNIFYSPSNETDELFGVLDLGYKDKFQADGSPWTFKINSVYQDKHFNNEADARDKFFSGFMELRFNSEQIDYGISIDPQYSQFVTSDTDGGLITPGKQRISTLKSRIFSQFKIGDASSIELGAMFKTKDYRDSDSDYDSWIYDISFRTRLSDTLRLRVGALVEDREYDDRFARTNAGTTVLGETVEQTRTTGFTKVTYRPDSLQKYSLKVYYQNNEDEFQDYHSRDKLKIVARSQYEWNNGIVLDTAFKLGNKDYDEQISDSGSSLEDDKYSIDLELDVPLQRYLRSPTWEGWRGLAVLEYKEYDSGLSQREYERTSVSLGLHKSF